MQDLRWLRPEERFEDEAREYGTAMLPGELDRLSQEYSRFDGEVRAVDFIQDFGSLLGLDSDAKAFFEDFARKSSESKSELEPNQLKNRIHNAWLARVAGCTLGKPVESWPQDRINEFLQILENRELVGYLTAVGVTPGNKFVFENFNLTGLRENLTRFPQDDDIDYTILNLIVAENNGDLVTSEAVVDAWTRLLPVQVLCTAERVAYQNSILGLQPPYTAFVRNPYRQWIGALIRADLWGYISPGAPARAARLAYLDARVSHVEEGIWGAVWVASLISCVLGGLSVRQALIESLKYVKLDSAIFRLVEKVTNHSLQGTTIDEVVSGVIDPLRSYNWVHVLPNVAIIAVALAYIGHDLRSAWSFTLSQGLDTDSNCATVGSILGSAGLTIPEAFVALPKVAVTTAIPGHDGIEIAQLAERTATLALKSLRRTEQVVFCN